MKISSTSKRLKEIMRDRNLRQVDIVELCRPFAKKYGVRFEKNDLSQYVSGKVTPMQDKLTVLADALGVSEAWLMGYDVTGVENLEKQIFSDDNFTLTSATRRLKPGADKLIGGQLLAMTAPIKEAKGAQEQEVEYYPETDEPTREYMLDFIDREYPTAAFNSGDIHTMNYEELREYYEAVLEKIREEDGK